MPCLDNEHMNRWGKVNLVESDSTEKSSDKSYGPSSRIQGHFERYSSTGLELIDRIPVF